MKCFITKSFLEDTKYPIDNIYGGLFVSIHRLAPMIQFCLVHFVIITVMRVPLLYLSHIVWYFFFVAVIIMTIIIIIMIMMVILPSHNCRYDNYEYDSFVANVIQRIIEHERTEHSLKKTRQFASC